MKPKTIFLKSGELILGTKGEVLSTVLGSCLSICIFDKVKKMGGMTHYLLSQPFDEVAVADKALYNYGIYALPALLKKLKELGSERQNLSAKIIGGANNFDLILGNNFNIGEANLKIAYQLLTSFGIPIKAEDVGGNYGRKVEFNTATGEIRFKKEILQRQEILLPSELSLKSVQSALPFRIKVLIVDDSSAIRKLIRKMIEIDNQIEVVGEADNPLIAEELRKKYHPHVMTLDLHMPIKNGVTYLREFMATEPMATIIFTDCSLKDTGPVMDALEAGAFDYVQKPAQSQIAETSKILISKIKEAAKVDTEKLARSLRKSLARKPHPIKIKTKFLTALGKAVDSVIAIGASTGGTEAIKHVLMGLPSEIPPVLIVQHMPPGFTKSFADRLNELCPFHVKEAEDGDVIENGFVYVAPGGKQMAIILKGTGLFIRITDDPEENHFKPSVDYLFRSLSKITTKHRICILLTGMGGDGAKEMLTLRNQGVYTIAQDEATCVVFGMPKVAIEIGAAYEIKALEQIAGSVLSAVEAKFSLRHAK